MLDRIVMIRKKVLAFSFAAAILAAHCHCLVEHAREMRAAMPCPSVATTPNSPVTPGCENESGCICKGATLVAVVDAPLVDSCFFAMHADLNAGIGDVAPNTSATSKLQQHYERAPRLSAQKVRALLQAYLI